MTSSIDLAEGARNLLVNCAGLKPGDRILVVHEDAVLGWYDMEASLALAEQAKTLGMVPTLLKVGGPEDDQSAREADRAAADHDCLIYMARIGDQDRFSAVSDGKIRVMSYARDAEMLASSYGRIPHQAQLGLKEAVNDVLLGANSIEVSCPLGTAFSGRITDRQREAADVSVRRFPMGVPQPLSANDFSGRIALARYLTPTGNRSYEPASLTLRQTVFANIDSGRITGYEGDMATVERIRNHYRLVSDKFGIDPDIVHSWHAGIHAGATYGKAAADDPDRWSNNVFTNPRFLHVHTCGAYAPGEICWMVLDPTVTVDGNNLWQAGRLRAVAFEQLDRCLQNWPELRDLLASPSDRIGLAK